MTLIPDSVYDLLTMERITSLYDVETVRRARVFFHDGSVLSFKMEREGCTCKVAEDALYAVRVSLAGGMVGGECSCGKKNCAHLVAALLTMQSRLPRRQQPAAAGALGYFRDNFHFVASSSSMRPQLRLALDLRELGSTRRSFTVALRLETSDVFPIMEPGNFLSSWKGRVPCLISTGLSYDPRRWLFTAADEEVLHLLQAGLQEVQGRLLVFDREQLSNLLTVLDGRTVDVQLDAGESRPLVVDARTSELVFAIAEHGEGGLMIRTLLEQGDTRLPLEAVRLLPGELPWGSDGRSLFRLRFSAAAGLKQAMSDRQGQAAIEIASEGATFVMAELLPFLEERGRVALEGRLVQAFSGREVPPRVVVRIDMEGIAVKAELLFRYGNRRVPWAEKGCLVRISDYRWQERLLDLEQEQADRLTAAGFIAGADGAFFLEDEAAVFRFIYVLLPELQQEWEILYSSRFRQVSKRLSRPSIGVKLTRKYNFMELDIRSPEKGVKIDPFAVLASARAGQGWVRLKEGQFLPLSAEQQELLRELAEKIDFRPVMAGGREIAGADPIFAPLVADILEDVSGEEAVADASLLAYGRSLVSWKCTIRPPRGLAATLREYQLQGFAWLSNIFANRLGGVLADDMGLGKTLQTITLIAKAVEEGETRPFLIICPSSLAFNWMQELARFAPGLSALNICGVPEKRSELFTLIPAQNVVVISYALLQRDQEALEAHAFAAVFLDEAQHIKNPGSGRTKSAKAVKADSRYALTGTPIENSLGELWSLFDFVLPGYLFTYRRFKEEIERPIMDGADAGKLRELKHRIAPFMLRRTKQEVLTQLPRKTEQVVYCPMEKAQREAYLSVLAFFDTRLLPLLEKDGIQTHSLEILAALTRLRQICCHPGLALEKYAGAPSGKLDLLFEIIDQAVDGGHKTLVFSQFTGMLDLIQAGLAERGLSLVRLDGSTSVARRGKLVDRFNSDPGISTFLISLKAGGTGLNLTAADTVIHVDPWWNPAAEDQASARAHRMGQKNPVNVYKLIAENSVEEKILHLQQDKKKLFEAVVGSGGAAFNRFSLDQIRDLFRA